MASFDENCQSHGSSILKILLAQAAAKDSMDGL
jgi:hypothetical protein